MSHHSFGGGGGGRDQTFAYEGVDRNLKKTINSPSEFKLVIPYYCSDKIDKWHHAHSILGKPTQRQQANS